MNIRSLRLRLLAGGAVAILAALVVAWFAMMVLFERNLQRREAAELIRRASQLVVSLHIQPGGTPVLDAPLSDQRFLRASSGLYWQVSTAAGTLRSRSLSNQALPEPRDASDTAWQTRVSAGPFGQRLLMVERRLHLANSDDGAVIQVAYDRAAFGGVRSEFGQELMLFLVGLWIVLSTAAAVQVNLGLKPLRKLHDVMTVLRRSPSERLAISDHPPEVEPLMRAINDLAEAREKDLQRARRRAADLAHALKTPLAGLAAQSRRVREVSGPVLADGLDQAISAATAAVDSELARTRSGMAREGMRSGAVAVRDAAERVIDVIERTEAGSRLVFEVDAPDGLRLPPSLEEMAEIVGALLDNAVRYARRRVRVFAGAGEGALHLHIEDDGPGIDERRMEDALMRGKRLDETEGGHGLGLSIARDLVEARGGKMVLGRSDLGGLKVGMIWELSSVPG